MKSLSCVRLFATPWTVAHQAPLSLGFSRQEHWSGVPFPSPMHESESENEVTQLCPTLCDPMDCSLPGSSVHRIFQARVLEWVAISFFNEKQSLLSFLKWLCLSIYFWLCWVVLLHSGFALAAVSGGYPPARAHGLQQLQGAGAVAGAHGLSCSATWDLLRQGSNQYLWHWQTVLSHWTTREAPPLFF